MPYQSSLMSAARIGHRLSDLQQSVQVALPNWVRAAIPWWFEAFSVTGSAVLLFEHAQFPDQTIYIDLIHTVQSVDQTQKSANRRVTG
jgi:hypothetical protein